MCCRKNKSSLDQIIICICRLRVTVEGKDQTVNPLRSGPSGRTCLVRWLEKNKTNVLSFALARGYYLLEITSGKKAQTGMYKSDLSVLNSVSSAVWACVCVCVAAAALVVKWWWCFLSRELRLSLPSQIKMKGMCLSLTPCHKHSHTLKPMCRSFITVSSSSGVNVEM